MSDFDAWSAAQSGLLDDYRKSLKDVAVDDDVRQERMTATQAGMLASQQAALNAYTAKHQHELQQQMALAQMAAASRKVMTPLGSIKDMYEDAFDDRYIVRKRYEVWLKERLIELQEQHGEDLPSLVPRTWISTTLLLTLIQGPSLTPTAQQYDYQRERLRQQQTRPLQSGVTSPGSLGVIPLPSGSIKGASFTSLNYDDVIQSTGSQPQNASPTGNQFWKKVKQLMKSRK